MDLDFYARVRTCKKRVTGKHAGLRNKQMHEKLNLIYLRMRRRFISNGQLHRNH